MPIDHLECFSRLLLLFRLILLWVSLFFVSGLDKHNLSSRLVLFVWLRAARWSSFAFLSNSCRQNFRSINSMLCKRICSLHFSLFPFFPYCKTTFDVIKTDGKRCRLLPDSGTLSALKCPSEKLHMSTIVVWILTNTLHFLIFICTNPREIVHY